MQIRLIHFPNSSVPFCYFFGFSFSYFWLVSLVAFQPSAQKNLSRKSLLPRVNSQPKLTAVCTPPWWTEKFGQRFTTVASTTKEIVQPVQYPRTTSVHQRTKNRKPGWHFRLTMWPISTPFQNVFILFLNLLFSGYLN